MTSCTASCDRHEVAGDVGVGDGDRPAGGDLRGEGVSTEPRLPSTLPNRTDEVRARRPRGARGGEPFGDPLGVAEHAARVGGLVGRDVDEPLDAAACGRVEHGLGADDVGLDRLGRVLLEQRQVLERGGVEDDLGAAVARRPRATRGVVADVAEHDVVGVEQRPAVDRQLHGVQRGLVAVEHDQLGRAEPVDLAAQLRADRAAGAGDQHPLAGEVAGDGVDVGVDLVAAEEVGRG